MENILKFIPKIINGIVFASYEIEGFLYRAEPIKRKQDIVIMGMTKNQNIAIIHGCTLHFLTQRSLKTLLLIQSI